MQSLKTNKNPKVNLIECQEKLITSEGKKKQEGNPKKRKRP